MKKIQLIPLLVVFTFYWGCNSPKKNTTQQDPDTIEIDVKLLSEEFDLAPFVGKEWDIIALETTENSLISYCDKIVYENNRYYIMDNASSAILIFDDKGKFISGLNKKGNGPDEYLSIGNFVVIKENIWLADNTSQRLLCYDKDFNLIHKVNTGMRAYNVAEAFGNIYLGHNRNDYEKENFQLWKYDMYTGSTASYIKVDALPPDRVGVIKRGQFAQSGDELLFFYSYNDTIFEIKENEVVPKYRFAFSERYEDKPLTQEEMMADSDLIRGLLSMQKTKKSIILEYVDRNNLRMAIYNEEKKETGTYAYFTHSALGALRILQAWFTKNQDVLCTYEPETLLEYYKEIIDDSKFENEADKEKINQVISTLEIDHNPVIIRFKLREDSLF